MLKVISYIGIAVLCVSMLAWRVAPQFKAIQPEIASVQELASSVLPALTKVQKRFPNEYKNYFGAEVNAEVAEEALTLGRDVYVAEGCWNCHTQWVRENDQNFNWGKPSEIQEVRHELMLPSLIGNRRVGPDLFRLADRQSLDWHAPHLIKPSTTSPGTVMPAYPWLFEKESSLDTWTIIPKKKGLALMIYLDGLGRWEPSEELTTKIKSEERSKAESFTIAIYLAVIGAYGLLMFLSIKRGDASRRNSSRLTL